jgi:ornithine cyclodeaminase/alanine dehydrogenase-like protein (mu-crystallin family)
MHIAAIKSQEWSDATLAKGDLIVAVSVNEYLTYSAGEGQYGRQIPASESKFMKGRELPLLEDIIAGKIAGRTRSDQITMLRNGSGIGIQFAAVADGPARRDAIDELKVSVPVWKKEIYVGGETWVGQGS